MAIAAGGDAGEQYTLAQDVSNFTPRASGELFLFVNDAIPPLRLGSAFPFVHAGWDTSYADNRGTVTVRIQRLP